jgi:TonB family protein
MIRTNFKWGKVVSAALLLLAMGLATLTSPAQEATTRKVLANPPAAYPEVAKRLRLSGVVKVQVVIGTDGLIKDVKLIGGHPLFVNAVQETLKSWKYAPASTETRTTLEFNFQP